MYPFELNGPTFLALYAGTTLGAWLVSGWYRETARNNGTGCTEHPLQMELDPYEMAYLRGGSEAVVDAGLASLVQSRVFVIEGSNVRIDRSVPWDMNMVTNELRSRFSGTEMSAREFRTNTVLTGRRDDWGVDTIRQKLIKAGFIVSPNTGMKMQLFSGLIAASPMLIGIPKLMIGNELHRPTGFLVFGLVIVFIGALIQFCKIPHRTIRGDQALEELEKRNAALKVNVRSNADALSASQVSTAAALFGTTIFSYGMIGDYYKRIAPPSSGGSGCGSSSSCSSGGSCGGGGCGGGGCGGCGG